MLLGMACPLTNYPVLPACEMADDWKWPPYKSPLLLAVAFVEFYTSDQDDLIWKRINFLILPAWIFTDF